MPLTHLGDSQRGSVSLLKDGGGAVVAVEHRLVRGSPPITITLFQLLEQCVYQILHPFSIPAALAFRGRAAVRNMRLGCCVGSPSTGHAVAQGFQWMLIICLVVIACVSGAYLPPPERAASPEEAALLATLQVEVAAVFTAALFQRLAVATKWAYLPPAQYARLMRVEESYEALAGDQLLAGWAKPAPALVEAELEAAGTRAGFNPHGVAFALTRSQRAAVVATLSGERGAGAVGAAATKNPLLRDAPTPVWVAHTDGKDTWYVCGEETSWELPPGAQLAGDGAGGVSGCHWGPAPTLPVSAFSLARRMVLHACDATAALDGRVNVAFLVACGGNAFLPAAVRGATGLPPFGRGGADSLVLALTSWLQFLFPFIVMSYIRVGIVDYHRRADTLETLVHLASRSLVAEGSGGGGAARLPQRGGGAPAAAGGLDELAGDSGGTLAEGATAAAAPADLHLAEPAIPLGVPGNAVAWLATRRLLLGFGARYVARVEAYASQALLLSLALSVALLALLLVGGTSSSRGVASAPTLVFSAIGLYALALLGVGLVVMLRDGARANNAAAEHAAVLTARALEVAQRAEGEASSGSDDAHALAATERVLCRVGDLLRAQAQLEPITILGVPASYALMRTLLAGFTSVVSVVAQQAQRRFAL